MSDKQASEIVVHLEAEQALDLIEQALADTAAHLGQQDAASATEDEQALVLDVQDAAAAAAEVRSALRPPPSIDSGSAQLRQLVISVTEEHARRLEALWMASGGPEPDAAAMAQVVVAEYAPVLAVDFCFEHRREGCGDAQGRHVAAEGLLR